MLKTQNHWKTLFKKKNTNKKEIEMEKENNLINTNLMKKKEEINENIISNSKTKTNETV